MKRLQSYIADDELFSIGNVAELTGITADTIRVWERRYGKPQPVRLPSGHRRYTRQHVRWLRRVAEALARGNRPSRVVGLSESAINRLLDGDPAAPVSPELDNVLSSLARFDVAAVRAQFRTYIDTHGVRKFLTAIVHPLLHQAGRAWADDRLQTRHEHLMSQILEDSLRSIRQSIPQPVTAPTILLATLSGERHGLGLQTAAIAAALTGIRPLVLGPDTPTEEIVLAATDVNARIVGISVSLATGGVETDRQLTQLREALPSDVHLVIGGQGARGVRRGRRGIGYVDTLEEFFDYAERFVR